MLKLLLSISLCCSLATFTYGQSDADSTKEFNGKVEIRVDGVACPFCSYGLEKKLLLIDGVESYKIDIDKGIVTLKIINGKSIKEKELKEKVIEAGFTLVEVRQITAKES